MCRSLSYSPHHHTLAAPFMPSLCVSFYSNIVLLSACQRLPALCIGHSISGSLLCLSVVLYSSTNNAFFLWSLQHSDLGWSVCLPTTLWCLLVCHCMFRAGRVDVNGGLQQVRRGCMVSPGRSVFRCPLVGAESDSYGRNGRWKGLIFRHNRVHVQTQGAVLWKSSPRGVYPAHFPARQGENLRRPISSAHFTLDVNGYPVVSPNDQDAPCCVVYPNINISSRRIRNQKYRTRSYMSIVFFQIVSKNV